MLNNYFESNKEISSGLPMLPGTRFPIAQLLCELKERSAKEIAEDYDLSISDINLFLENLSLSWNKRNVS